MEHVLCFVALFWVSFFLIVLNVFCFKNFKDFLKQHKTFLDCTRPRLFRRRRRKRVIAHLFDSPDDAFKIYGDFSPTLNAVFNKTCPSCGYWVINTAYECPYCGFEFGFAT